MEYLDDLGLSWKLYYKLSISSFSQELIVKVVLYLLTSGDI